VDAILAPGLLDARDVEGHHRVLRVTRAQLDDERARAVDSRCSCRPVAMVPEALPATAAAQPHGATARAPGMGREGGRDLLDDNLVFGPDVGLGDQISPCGRNSEGFDWELTEVGS